MLIKLVVKIYSLNLVSAYRGYTLIVFMTQGYLTAKRLRTTELYHESYLKYGFIATGISHIPTPLCIVCCNRLCNGAMKPSKLFCHLNTKQPGLKEKPLEYFERKKKKNMKNRKNF